jgi:hypothetical protein
MLKYVKIQLKYRVYAIFGYWDILFLYYIFGRTQLLRRIHQHHRWFLSLRPGLFRLPELLRLGFWASDSLTIMGIYW